MPIISFPDSGNLLECDHLFRVYRLVISPYLKTQLIVVCDANRFACLHSVAHLLEWLLDAAVDE